MRSTIGIEIAAPAELVFRLARDVERWPQLLPHYVRADRVGVRDDAGRLLVRFVARRTLVPVVGLGIPVAWRSWTWAEPETLQLRFVHRGGATNGMDVTWRIEGPGAGGGATTRVEIEHDFRPRFQPWAAVVDRLFTRPIAGRTLATFRAIAEAVAAGTSDPLPATNPSV
ncbi:MAG TPA: SRPBCC family protein [Candidatus Limnocylindrales bacterium]|nr:SRPBCC family protein [Candidatus Limnocylindrales bacterium]